MSQEIVVVGFDDVESIFSKFLLNAKDSINGFYEQGTLKNEDVPVVIADTIKNAMSESRQTYESLIKVDILKKEHQVKLYREDGVTLAEDGTVTLNIGADSLKHHMIEEYKKRIEKISEEINLAKREHKVKLYRDDGVTVEDDGTITLNIGADSLKHHQIETMKKQQDKLIADKNFVITQDTEMQEQVVDNRIIKIAEIFSDFIMAIGNAGVEPSETLFTNFLLLTKLGLLRTGVSIAEDGTVTAKIKDYNNQEHTVDLAQYKIDSAKT